MDTTKLRDLLDKRDALDEEILALVNGTKERKPQRCSICQSDSHTARNCGQRTKETNGAI